MRAARQKPTSNNIFVWLRTPRITIALEKEVNSIELHGSSTILSPQLASIYLLHREKSSKRRGGGVAASSEEGAASDIEPGFLYSHLTHTLCRVYVTSNKAKQNINIQNAFAGRCWEGTAKAVASLFTELLLLLHMLCILLPNREYLS